MDLKTNQVTFADTAMNLDLDLPAGRGESMQASGTLAISIRRMALQGEGR